ncbi:hypothetical protein KC19_4G086200 [Ceratodon purpureus]|uniref:DUF1995 domain-containing protein n=1 Tax=Ceratodon purpureus TaxID=3225 RepID=A0A8T0I6G3_CERPU|nr:hypothetical protein KC19_4G086200 [Ceratodon purpureus]
MMLHSPTWKRHGSMAAELGMSNSLQKGNTKVGSGFLQTRPLIGFSNKGLKNVKLEKHVVRSQSGSEPKPKVINKSINFPKDYNQLVEQARKAAQAALKDGKTLLEVEFPTAGLDTVPGDEEGGIEMTTSIVLMKEFCTIFKDESPTTRIFFPDMKDMELAKTSIFDGTSFKLDYLTKPNGLEDFGFGRKVKMADRVQASDKVFVVAYPYFNVNEMIAVEELYKDSAAASKRPIIIFNGELDRIRSGYYPAFFYPKLGSIAKEFLPKFETVYYIHNFKGRSGGVLFRMYPGPWQVLQRVKDDKYVLLHEQASMPSLKEVALNILPTA